MTTGGNCSRFFATDISFDANPSAFYYRDDGRVDHPAVSAGFWPMVDIVGSEIGSGVYTSTGPIPYRGSSCNRFHTYSGAEVLQRNYALCKAMTQSCDTPVQTARFPGATAAIISHHNSTMWEGMPVFNWMTGQGDAVQSALLANVDLTTTPSLAGKAVYIALQARLPASDTTVRLTLGVDAGDGAWQYSDDHGSEPEPMAAGGGDHRRGEWSMFSYQAMLRMNGTARFAIFNWQQQSQQQHGGGGDGGGGTVLLSGPVAVAAVGTRFSGAAVNT